MDQKRVGWVLAALGAALLVVSALADPIGLGDEAGIGVQQSVGILLGAAVIGAGVWLMRRHASVATPPRTDV